MTAGTQDADSILSQALRMNMHEVPSFYNFSVAKSMLVCLLGHALASTSSPEFIAKQVPCKIGLYSKEELSVKTFVRYKDGGICNEVDSPFCKISTKISVHQSKSFEDREIGRRYAPLWKVLSTKLQEILPERDVSDAYIVSALDVRSQILSIFDRRNGAGKLVVKLAPPGHEQLFDLSAPYLCELGISDDVQRQVICQAKLLARNRAANV